MVRKRGQNEGSIFQRKDGRWCAQFSDGKGGRVSRYARTAQEARAKLHEARQRAFEGRQLSDDARPLRDLIAAWLKAKSKTVRPKTLSSYQGLMGKHVVPAIGHIKIKNLTMANIEMLYRHSSASPKTVRNLHFVVKACLEWGRRHGWLARNPADDITVDDLPRVHRRHVPVLSPDDCKKLISAAQGTKSEALITMALTTGARVGELMALTWDAVDLDTGTAEITSSLQYVAGKPVMVEPKTKAGVRRISLADITVEALRRHRATQNESALMLGRAWSNALNLMFTRSTGEPLNRHAVLRQYFRPILSAAGLNEELRFHDLRHGAASLLLSRGVPIPVVSQMLGHANPSITMSLYSWALPDSQREAAKAMDSLFG